MACLMKLTPNPREPTQSPAVPISRIVAFTPIPKELRDWYHVIPICRSTSPSSGCQDRTMLTSSRKDCSVRGQVISRNSVRRKDPARDYEHDKMIIRTREI
ncbi:hypothetical protein FRC03_007741 [Tulasnella sp. 419]|nr:hypothetical protein FRC03_007741 [Tulasnella sp. 419]